MKNIFPLIDENIVNIDIGNPNTTECTCCREILGKKITHCTICNKNIHKRCSLDKFGCKKCRDDMFPASCDIFSSGVNSRFFDPYNPDSLINLIGNNDDIEAESETLRLSCKKPT